jgi:hypothetical protein
MELQQRLQEMNIRLGNVCIEILFPEFIGSSGQSTLLTPGQSFLVNSHFEFEHVSFRTPIAEVGTLDDERFPINSNSNVPFVVINLVCENAEVQ